MQAEVDEVVVVRKTKKQEPPIEQVASLWPGPSIHHWRKVAPNSVTCLGTAVGLSAIKFAQDKHWEWAVLAILLAGILDGLDGPVARALGGASRFGAELDSLSDYVNFGVSPGILLYYWSFQSLGWPGWIVSLVYIIAMGCRLARFNAGVDFNATKATRGFFMGVPAPAGAALAVMPMITSFWLKNNKFSDPTLVIPYVLVVAMLSVSRLPTFSSKLISRDVVGPATPAKICVCLAVVGGIGFMMVTSFWAIFVLLWLLYIASFPVSFCVFQHLSKRHKE
eukprot:TRINITY_DN12485_c0_g1_i1.p1 TRINITY_DN12485_c0_g1~~TRINITY_DN12485_c0_g1_i1.p1  ORF type:complete len:292 (-),score=60.12 TRINITY_DN12485_c0_g1_i1:74-913(-)